MEHHEELHREGALEDPYAGEVQARWAAARGPSQSLSGSSVATTVPPTRAAVCDVAFVTLSVINYSFK